MSHKTLWATIVLSLILVSGPAVAQDSGMSHDKMKTDSVQTGADHDMMKQCMKMMKDMHSKMGGQKHQMKSKEGSGMEHSKEHSGEMKMEKMKSMSSDSSSAMGSEGMMSMSGDSEMPEMCKKMMEKMHQEQKDSGDDAKAPSSKNPPDHR